MGQGPPVDPAQMTETPGFQDFQNLRPDNREALVAQVKATAADKGFRAIIPFSDRTNRTTQITYFVCSCSGTSVRKSISGCPFKLTYMK